MARFTTTDEINTATYINMRNDSSRLSLGREGEKNMSRWAEVKFKGTVKPELREAFAKAMEMQKWSASGDEVLTDFEECYEDNANLYLGISKPSNWEWSVSRWNKDDFHDMYDKETGVWQFKRNYNTHNHGNFFVDFEDEIVPYLMESVEWMEEWLEPFYDDDNMGTVLQKMEKGEELEAVGFFDTDGTFRKRE